MLQTGPFLHIGGAVQQALGCPLISRLLYGAHSLGIAQPHIHACIGLDQLQPPCLSPHNTVISIPWIAMYMLLYMKQLHYCQLVRSLPCLVPPLPSWPSVDAELVLQN